MADVFKLIATHVRRWAAIIQDFTPQQRDVVKKTGEDMKAEMARIAANGESATKPKYLAALKAIVELIGNIS
jgi:hypothetical protein